MALSINSNIASLNAQRNLSKSQATLNTSLQRLSSGLRINSARDDAAGLAISERFTTQIRGLNQASRNASDGISLAQTAEGDLSQITNNLQRIRELAVQSANATNSASDRAALQLETAELIAEIDRVASTSAFNSVNLLDGNFASQLFQVGANSGETVSIASIGSARTDALGQTGGATVTGTGPVTADLLAGDLTINGTAVAATLGDASLIATAIGATGTAISATAVNTQTAIAFADVVGTVASGATPTTLSPGNYTQATSNSTAGSTVTTGGINTAGYDYSGANVSFTVDGNAVALTTNLANIGALTIEIQADLDATAGANVYTVSDDGTDVTITKDGVGSNSTAPVLANGVGTNNADFVTNITASNGTADSNFAVSIDGISLYTETATVGGTVTAAELDTALTSFIAANSVYSISSGSFAGGNLLLAKADGTDIAVTFGSNFNTAGAFVTTTSTNGTAAIAAVAPDFNLSLDGVALNLTASGGDGTVTGSEVASVINAVVGYSSTFSGGNLTVTKADSTNFVLAESGGAAGGAGLAASSTTYRGTVTVTATDSDLTIAGADPSKAGLSPGVTASALLGTTITNTDISTVAGANAAILSIDSALTAVNNSRASLGAIQNRFDSIVASIDTSSENLSAARSRIRDADFASETAALIRGQILQQAGVSILSQANSLPQLALSLLQ